LGKRVDELIAEVEQWIIAGESSSDPEDRKNAASAARERLEKAGYLQEILKRKTSGEQL
jgi:hypothetical protein